MKTTFLKMFCALFIAFEVHAQELALSGQLLLGGNYLSVTDQATAPSDGLDNDGYLRNPSDGETGKVKDGIAVGFGLLADYYFQKGIGAFAGLNFLAQDFSIYNRDGGYYGNSTYSVAYMQIPLGVSYLSKELAPGLKLYGRLGLSLDLKIKEDLKDNDGAHFWNLAKNLSANDPTRGRNADNKSMALFAPLRTGVVFGIGAEYAIAEKLRPFLGIGVHQGITNILNPALKHNDVNETPITDNLKMTLSAITLDLGVRF